MLVISVDESFVFYQCPSSTFVYKKGSCFGSPKVALWCGHIMSHTLRAYLTLAHISAGICCRVSIMEDKQKKRTPFKWRENTATERRRMRKQGKKRKRLQRRKEYDKCKFKANAVIEGLTDRLRIETKQRKRLLFLARKYYLKWKENKDLLLRRNGGNLPSASRFGTRAKVSK